MTVEPLTDLRAQPHEDVLDRVEHWLELRLNRQSAMYGNDGGTVGFATSENTWVRVQWRRIWVIHGQSWTGAECASALRGVAKPELLRSVRWRDPLRDVVWRAEEMSLIRSSMVASSGSVAAEPDLSAAWWAELRRSLAALAGSKTDRVGMAQGHLSRRISEAYGAEVDTTVEEWTTAHADLHWGNLTAPECSLLDWEDWGLGPRGLDAATLWGFSLGVPALAERIQTEF